MAIGRDIGHTTLSLLPSNIWTLSDSHEVCIHLQHSTVTHAFLSLWQGVFGRRFMKNEENKRLCRSIIIITPSLHLCTSTKWLCAIIKTCKTTTVDKHVGMVLGTATNRSFLSCRKSTVDREALPWKTLNDAICCLTLQCAHAMA